MRAQRTFRTNLSDSTPKILPGAEPIFVERGENAILFIHGFTGSTYEGREFADYFAERNYTVWVPLLKGHGTHPRNLKGVRWQDWHQQIRDCLMELKQRYQKVAVCGQSMGGSLALHLAAHYPVDALITLAGAVFLSDWRLKFIPLVRKFLFYQYKSKGPDIRSRQAKRKSIAYPKYPVTAVVELMELLAHVKNDIMDIRVPVLLLHSRKDHVVPYENLDFIYQRVASEKKERFSFEKSYHILSVDVEQRQVFQKIEMFLRDTL